MANATKYPLGLYSAKVQQRKPIETYQILVSKESTVIEVPEESLRLNESSLIFIDGFLVSSQEYTIANNIVTLATPTNRDVNIIIVK